MVKKAARTQGNGAVVAAKIAGTQGKGSAVATKAANSGAVS